MYNPVKNGTSINIQGLECHLPPVGYVMNVLTGKLEKRDIICRSPNIASQYWEREEMPDWYKKKSKEVEKIRKINPEHSDVKCDEYEAREWDRRLNGCWIMIKGKPVYLTGLFYMFLQWWKIDIGYPRFRIPDLEYFYFLQYCIEDPRCMGMLEVTKRRFGKSFRAGIFAYEYTARMQESQSGIQSKTGPDAKKFFGKVVIKPFKSLPKFFRPEYDQSQGITPKSEIRFQQTNIRGKKAEETLEKEELGSLIDFATSELTAYDGQKLHRYVADECGKTVEVNIYDRHEVVRYCLLDDEGNVIGKALYTTTVEKLETDKGGISDAFKHLWKDSDQNERKKNGRTASGLYRFFMTADRTRHFDKYGEPDVERTIQEILDDRESVAHNPRSLSARIRKEPRTIEEAFRSDGDNCMFNDIKLNDQRDVLMWNKDLTERGNLVWKDGIRDSKVVWEKNPNGRWEMPRGFNPKDDELNLVERRGNQFYPTKNFQYGSSIDPYDHDQTQDNAKRSHAASTVKQKTNLNNHADIFIGTYVSLYYARPNTAAIMYEDMIKQCHYFGCSILAENNKPGIINYFRNRGYGAFLLHLPGYKEPGIPSTPENKQTACELVEAMVEHNSHKMYFLRQIDDLLKFDINKTKEFDIGMTTLWTEMACAHKSFILKDEPESIDISTLFNLHKVA
jgi:hypothetical protein